ncbi:MAG: Asp-tRNA(Asn)/Glu-tRNA(Gln) amidotransferase subunit GatA [SAR324 cluster bacterium]|nr:Asp-tRNA(Asn)/Glu-tRNA(Gln) amidotransferase subunit GatA [SAR324 cluster bacterium]
MISDLPLSALVEQIRSGAVKAEAVMASVYDVIDEREPQLNAYRSRLSRETALARAAQVDQRVAAGESVGRLAGLPVSIKDCICVADPELTNTCGSRILEGYRSPYHATAVEKLLAEDAIIIGTTNMDEFAMGGSTESSAYGVTRNPHSPEHVPGGSSGGAAVSVAAGMALLALGTDTGGSVRQPAAYCGITGMKPTYGTLSRYGLIAYGSSFDQIGVLARNAEDCRYACDLLQGHDPKDSTSATQALAEAPETVDLADLRVCLPEEYLTSDSLDPEVRESVLQVAEQLRANGAVVEQRSLPFLESIIPTYYTLAFAEASSNLGRFDGIRYGVRKQREASLKSLYATSREQGFGTEVKRRIMLGTFVLSSGYYDQYYGRATQVRELMRTQVQTLLDEFDVILGPTSPVPPFRFGEKTADPLTMYLIDLCSVLANLTYTPAVSIPGKPTASGLPIGVQLMGRRFEDRRLLAVATALQEGQNP